VGASVQRHDGHIAIAGTLTEDDDLIPLAGGLTGKVTIDLSGLRRINSAGVRMWMLFVRAVPPSVELTLEKCSVPFVNQMNLVRDFVGGARVTSVYVPYLCTKCSKSPVRLASLGEAMPEAGKCDCGGALEMDADEQHYLAFQR